MLGAARSERLGALLLFAAAALGLILANVGLGPALTGAKAAEFGPDAIGLRLSTSHWISDGLLALFFVVAAIELRGELRHGELSHWSAAAVPAIAAAGGVALPAIGYLLIAHDPALARGWPVPTATDIAFALGVLAIFGRGLPSRVRALLLGIAVLDDLVAITILAVAFTDGISPVPLVLAAVVLVAFAFISRFRAPRRFVVPVAILLALAVWYLVHASGVHATIAGVAIGLVLPDSAGERVDHALEPVINLLVLPLFALDAASVVIPSSALGPVFWAVALALPIGKLIGIGLAAAIAQPLLRRPKTQRMPAIEILVVAALGGTGFTVALLMAQLAFRGDAALVDEATLGVLAGTAVALVLGVALTAVTARRARLTSS